MLFKRAYIAAAGQELPAKALAGTGCVENIAITTIATDANLTLTANDLAGGAVRFSGFSAGRNVTTPTAAQLAAAAPDMDIGDAFTTVISVTPAFAATWVAGTGITLAGRATTPASSMSYVVVTKTGAAAFTWTVL